MNTYFYVNLDFGNIEISDYELSDLSKVSKINEKVLSNTDIVYIFGDLIYNSIHKIDFNYINKLLAKIKGIKILIPSINNANLLDNSIVQLNIFREKMIQEIKINGNNYVLSYYQLATWPGKNRGIRHLYGTSPNGLNESISMSVISTTSNDAVTIKKIENFFISVSIPF